MKLDIIALDGVFQNAYVTHDIDRAIDLMRQRHGLGEFVRFEPEMQVHTAAGGTGPCHLKAALGWAGALNIELIQPVSGNVALYRDYLPRDEGDFSPRFHHVGIRARDWIETRAEVDRMNWPIAYEGGIEGCRFVYLDTRDSLGHYVEYLWASPDMWAGMGGG